jgi:hypothetical protein
MALRHVLVAFALVVGSAASAAPKKTAPPAPANTGSAAGSDASSGSAVEPIEEAPSATQMNGTDDNPDNPHALTNEEPAKPAVVAAPTKKDYPVELVLRPITLTQNLTEISIAPHFQVSPFQASDAIHARYGITDKLQIGITYLYLGVWDRSLVDSGAPSSYGAHVGKAFGVDATYSIFDWLAVQVGVPFYVSPFAISLQLAAPLKFHITDKFALGGLDDLLNITLHNFAPSFYQEFLNAVAANNNTNQTGNSRGQLRISVYGEYQYTHRFAFFGRIGLIDDFGPAGGASVAGETSTGSSAFYIKGGFLWTPVDYLDFGASIGFDDLSTSGSFGPQLFLALRI